MASFVPFDVVLHLQYSSGFDRYVCKGNIFYLRFISIIILCKLYIHDKQIISISIMS